MIHYHGTPITPANPSLYAMAGKCLCVSFATGKSQLTTAVQIAQSVMFDNGAFTFYRANRKMDTDAFYSWIAPHLGHPHWAVIPDAIGGDVEHQRIMVNTWPSSMPKELGMPVWHLGLPIDYLLELADNWPRVCFGSSAEYWEVGSDAWCNRMDEAFNALSRRHPRLPWVHGLRMLGMSGMRWPLASADSTNVAQNHHLRGCPGCMADKIDAVQCPTQWTKHATQGSLLLMAEIAKDEE